jgi:hypothetical protein
MSLDVIDLASKSVKRLCDVAKSNGRMVRISIRGISAG